MIIRIFLVIYGLLALFIIYLLWRNPQSPNANQNTGVILASIIPVLILVLPLLKAEKMEKEFVYALFFDYENKQIVMGQGWGAYQSSYMPMFTNISTSLPGAPDSREECTKLFQAMGINMIEKGILQSLVQKFGNHWDIKPKKLRGPLYTSTSWSNNSKLKKTTIQLAHLKSFFKHNQIISSSSDAVLGSGLTIPPGSLHVSNTKNPLLRTLVLKNSFSSLEIKIQDAGGAIIQHEINGVLSPDPEKKYRYWAETYIVSMSMKLKESKVYSQNTKAYKRWFTNVADTLSDFDWQIIEKKIKEK